jgi:hypothetical protein
MKRLVRKAFQAFGLDVIRFQRLPSDSMCPRMSRRRTPIGPSTARWRGFTCSAPRKAPGCGATPAEEVRANLAGTGYPQDRLHFVEGPVEQTIGGGLPPEPVALLRLDTDWYESTRYELEQLFPRLVSGGILIIDDYGHWQGARKAVDDYFLLHARPEFLHRIDETGRLLIKQ